MGGGGFKSEKRTGTGTGTGTINYYCSLQYRFSRNEGFCILNFESL